MVYPYPITAAQFADKRIAIATILLTETLRSSNTPVDRALALADNLIENHLKRPIPNT